MAMDWNKFIWFMIGWSVSAIFYWMIQFMYKKLSSEWNGDILQNIWYDEWKDTTVLENQQNEDPILKYNKILRNEWDSRYKVGGHKEWHHAATIPMIVIEKLMRDGIWQDQKAMNKWLNDPANIGYRTSTSNIQEELWIFL